MKIIRKLVLTILWAELIALLWRLLEIWTQGYVTERPVDSIMLLIFIPFIYFAVSYFEDKRELQLKPVEYILSMDIIAGDVEKTVQNTTTDLEKNGYKILGVATDGTKIAIRYTKNNCKGKE